MRDELRVGLNLSFGQTEALFLIGTCGALEPYELEPLGKALPGHQISVLGPNFEAVPTGEVGQIAVRVPDPACMKSYFRDPDETSCGSRENAQHQGLACPAAPGS